MKAFRLLPILLLPTAAFAQAFSPLTWGIDKTVSPSPFAANVNNAWRTLGTVSSDGKFHLDTNTLNVGGDATFKSNVIIGNRAPIFDQGSQLQVVQNQTTWLPNGTLGPIFGMKLTTYSGGAPNDESTPLTAAVRGYNQVGQNVTYANEAGVLGTADNLSWKAQANGVFGSAKSHNGGRIWGGNLVATELPTKITATAGQTVFTLPSISVDASSGYAESTETVVRQRNGVNTQLVRGTDYTATGCSGGYCTGVTLKAGATAGDVIAIWRGRTRTGTIGVEVDAITGPGPDDGNPYTGGRIVGAFWSWPEDGAAPWTGVSHVGTGVGVFTGPSTVIDRALVFGGLGATKGEFAAGIDATNAKFSKAFIAAPAGAKISLGQGKEPLFPLDVQGASSDYANGVLARFRDTTNGVEFRAGASSAFSLGVVGTVSAHDLLIYAHNAQAVRIDADTIDMQLPLKGKAYAIADLPACNASTISAEAVVSNGASYSAGAYGSTVSAVGGVVRKVFCTNAAGGTTYGWVYN
jgi:hypothetical protein